ncbi:hypothetical protein FA13DRAFT_1746742, partial [Coprinellus micaceus]
MLPGVANLSALLANSWDDGADRLETADATTSIMFLKAATLPAASSSPSATKRPSLYSLPVGTDPIFGNWQLTDHKTHMVDCLIRGVATRFPTISPSAFFEAIEAVIEMFRVARDDPEAVEGLAVEAELLFVGSFFLIARAHYKRDFTTQELDLASWSRYGAYLQPSPWLSALSDTLDLQEEQADAAGLVRARTGIIADCRVELDAYRKERLSIRFHWQLMLKAQAAEEEARSIAEGYQSPAVPLLSATRSPRPTTESSTLPSPSIFTTPDSTVPLDILPSDSINQGLPHSVLEPLAALPADSPKDWREQLTEVRSMTHSVQSSLDDTLSQHFNGSPPSAGPDSPSPSYPNPHVSPPANLLEVQLGFPSSNSFASTLGSIQIHVLAPTPLLPLSVTIPESMEAAQPNVFLSNGPSDFTLSEGGPVEPLSNPSTRSDLSTLVGEGYTIMKLNEPFLATASSLPTGSSTTDWLAFCRGKSYRDATTLSDDHTGWLADGSSASSLALRRFDAFLRRLKVWGRRGQNTNVFVATAPPSSLT